MHVAPRPHALSVLFSPIYFATCLAVVLFFGTDKTPPPKPEQAPTFASSIVVWTLTTVVDSGVVEVAADYILHSDSVVSVPGKE